MIDSRLVYARQVLSDHAAACRSAGVRMPVALQALLALLVSDRHRPSLLGDEGGEGDPLLVNFDEAARRLAVSRSTVERLTRRGVLPTVPVAGRPRIAVADLVAFVEKGGSR